MKKHLILAAMAMTALFTACNNDETENITVDNNTVSFVIGGVDSRAITSYDTSNGYKTVFEQDDAIGIYSSGLANTQMENVEYTVGNDNKLTTTDNTEYEYTGTSEATFHAYFPHQETATSFTINTDQSSADNFHDNDFMTATTTASSGAVTLNFNHKLVLVEVNLNGFEEGTIISGVKLNSVKPTIAYTPATATLGEVSGDAGSIIMFPQTGNERYWAIIPAQTIAAGALFTVTTSDGDAYSYTTSGNTTFETGKLVRYNLTVGTETIKSLVEMGIPTIVEWGANNSVVEESGNLTEIINPLITEFNSNTTINSATAWSAIEENSWGYLYKSGNTVTNENGVIKVEQGTDNWSAWNNRSFFYRSKEKLNSDKTYTLTVTASCTNASENKASFMVSIADPTETKFYIIEENNSQYYSSKMANIVGNTDQTFTFTVNPKYQASSYSSSGASNTEGYTNISGQVNFTMVIATTTNSTTYYFKNIKLEMNE